MSERGSVLDKCYNQKLQPRCISTVKTVYILSVKEDNSYTETPLHRNQSKFTYSHDNRKCVCCVVCKK